MDTLLSQLVCSVVALLVYKYVETGQEAPGSYTWPHRSSPKILMIKGGFKKVSFQTSVILQMISCCCFFPCSLSWLFSSQLELCPIQVEGNARARDTSICFFHFVRIKIYLSVCSQQKKGEFKGRHKKRKNHFRWKRRTFMSDLFLNPLEEKIHHSSSLFVEGSKWGPLEHHFSRFHNFWLLWSFFSLFWTVFQTALCSSLALSSEVMERCWLAARQRRGRAWAEAEHEETPQTALGCFSSLIFLAHVQLRMPRVTPSSQNEGLVKRKGAEHRLRAKRAA